MFALTLKIIGGFFFSAGWVWGDHGWLNSLGAVDIAGSGPVSFIPIDQRLNAHYFNCFFFPFKYRYHFRSI